MNDDFVAKMHVTATVLNCATHKELCARFQAINPQTHCQLNRLNK